MKKIEKLLHGLKPRHAELAQALGVGVSTVRSYKLNSPLKLELMLEGLRYRKLVRLINEGKIIIKSE